jgi:yecA family protein
MFSIKEQKALTAYLQLAPYPEATLMYEELCGFLFGLAMTPEPIPVLEWLSVVYDDTPPDYQAKEAEGLVEAFTAAYEKLATAFAENTLRFPFDLENLREEEIDTVYNWVAGFDEALALRDAVWEPEEYPRMVRRKKEGLYNALMTIEGLVDPSEGMNMFADMSDQDFFQAFPDFADSSLDREEQVQWLLLSTLPLAVDTLLDHARDLARKKAKKGSSVPIKLPLPPRKGSDGPACSCPGGSCAGPQGKKKAKLIKVDFSKGGKKVEAATEILQLKISLLGTKPLIWRRIQIPDNYTLANLHAVIQEAMGWSDYHFHEFLIDRHTYCPPDDDGGEDSATARDERRYSLQELHRELLGGFTYVYDYGDDWLHEIKVEKVIPVAEGVLYPVLLAGKRACPPEDIGGVPGFLHLLEILADPKQDVADVFGEQLGDYDPVRFSKEEMAEINSRLRQMSPSKR